MSEDIQAQLQALADELDAINQERIKALPSELQARVPDNLDANGVHQWLNRLNVPSQPTQSAIKDMARNMGYLPKDNQ